MKEPFTPIPNGLIDTLTDAVTVYAILSRSANHHDHQTTTTLKIRKALVSFTLETGQVVIGERSLAERSGISRHTLKKLISDLETYGYIVADPEDGCTRYTITAEASETTIQTAKAKKAEKENSTAKTTAIEAENQTAIKQANKPVSEELPTAINRASPTAISDQYIDSINNQKDLLELPVDKSPERVEVIHTEEAGAEFSTSDRATTEEEPPREKDLTIAELLEEETRELTPVEKYLIRSRVDRAIRENREVDREIIRELVRVIKSTRP